MSSVYWILGKVREGLHPEKLSGLVWNSPEPPERHNKNRTKNYTQIEMKNQNPNVHSFFADWHFSMKFLWKKKFSIKVHIDFSANIDRMECWEWIEIWEFAVYNLHIFYLCNAMFIINYNILYCISMTACDSVTVWHHLPPSISSEVRVLCNLSDSPAVSASSHLTALRPERTKHGEYFSGEITCRQFQFVSI